MQNKPNFQKSQMNVITLLQMAYENKRDWTIGESKPNSNPIKPNCRKGNNWCKVCIYKALWRKMRLRAIKKQSQNKPNFRKAQNERNRFFTKGLWKWNRLQAQKNKPKQTQFVAA